MTGSVKSNHMNANYMRLVRYSILLYKGVAISVSFYKIVNSAFMVAI